MKPISFLGDSRDAIRDFPDGVRYRAGVELRAVQNGLEPNDLEADEGGRLRRTRNQDQGHIGSVPYYLAALADRILVLHAFQKKTQRTAAGYRTGRKAA
jgi:phage-related protein